MDEARLGEAPAERSEREFSLRQRIALFLISWIGYMGIRLIGSSLRFRLSVEDATTTDPDNLHTLICPFWHRCVFPATYFFRKRGFSVVTSRSFDGEYIARIIEKFGFKAVRGSSSRGGASALLQLHDIVNSGGLAAFTIDGPRGPRYVAKPGPILLAKNTGAAIMPFYLAPQRAWVLNSWDAFMIPKPFSRVVIRFGKHITVPQDANEDVLKLKLTEMQRGLEQVRDFAEAEVLK
jgi:lysophospholipid acyltransferase (LPLAT)-like uncharacterized protein